MVTRTKKIFVGGLSASTTLEDVKAYFQQFGKVGFFRQVLWWCSILGSIPYRLYQTRKHQTCMPVCCLFPTFNKSWMDCEFGILRALECRWDLLLVEEMHHGIWIWCCFDWPRSIILSGWSINSIELRMIAKLNKCIDCCCLPGRSCGICIVLWIYWCIPPHLMPDFYADAPAMGGVGLIARCYCLNGNASQWRHLHSSLS